MNFSPPTIMDELRRALAEQSFGVESYTVKESENTTEAAAVVKLLEGVTVVISLSSHGFHVSAHERDVCTARPKKDTYSH
jgi:hypothetical protein